MNPTQLSTSFDDAVKGGAATCITKKLADAQAVVSKVSTKKSGLEKEDLAESKPALGLVNEIGCPPQDSSGAGAFLAGLWLGSLGCTSSRFARELQLSSAHK
jgi:hypothetical protein